MRYALLDNIRSLKDMVRIDYMCTDYEFWQFVDYIIKGLDSMNWFENKNPRAVLGGVIYWCMIEKECNITQQHVANSLKIQTVSIRKHYHQLKEYMDKNFI